MHVSLAILHAFYLRSDRLFHSPVSEYEDYQKSSILSAILHLSHWYPCFCSVIVFELWPNLFLKHVFAFSFFSLLVLLCYYYSYFSLGFQNALPHHNKVSTGKIVPRKREKFA